MNVLVMGGTQFNGLALVHELMRAGHDSHDSQPRVKPRLQDACGRPTVWCAIAAITSALANPLCRARDWDCVYDISAYRPEDVATMIEALEGRTGHYIFASSTVIYAQTDLLPITESHAVERGPDQNAYGLNKLLCEDLLWEAWRKRRFPASIAAFSMVFGPHNIIPEREQRMFKRLLLGRKVMLPGRGRTVHQVGYVRDEARALRAMMLRRRTPSENATT